MVLRNQVNSSRNYGVAQKLVLKTKGPYRVLEKVTPILYWLCSFPFCEGLGSPGRKVKEPAASMEEMPSTVVIHKHVDGSDTIFSTISVPLVRILCKIFLE